MGAVLLASAACGDDDDSGGEDSSSRDSDVYTAIVDTVAQAEPVEDDATPIVYVAPLENEKPIPLDVQVSVVDGTADFAVVRFVDEAEQAIDQDGDGEPVIDDGVLLRLGEVPADGRTVDVPGEVYRTVADAALVEYTVRETPEGWVVASMRTPAA